MTDSEDINTLLRQILDELVAMRTESERKSELRELERKQRGERAMLSLAESRRLLAESRLALRELLGDDYVELPLSDNPIADTMRMLAESRRMLDEMLAEEPLADPLPD